MFLYYVTFISRHYAYSFLKPEARGLLEGNTPEILAKVFTQAEAGYGKTSYILQSSPSNSRCDLTTFWLSTPPEALNSFHKS